MTNQTQNPNDPKSASKGGQPQSQQSQDDAHTNSSRAGERGDNADANRKGGTQHGANTPQGGQQQGMQPDRANPGGQHGSQQGNQGTQGNQKGNDPSRSK
jgi:hypothetical protein